MKKPRIEPLIQPDKIINYWKKEKKAVAFIVIFGLGYNISTVLGPIYQGKLLDALLRGDSFNAIVQLAVIFVLLIAIIQLMRHMKRFYTRRFANSTSAAMRLIIYNNIINKSYIDLQHENTGDLMTRALADVDLCVDGMRKFTTEVFDTGVLMSAYFVTMLYYDVKITILGALFIPVAMLIAEKLKDIIYKFSIDYRVKSSVITGMTYDYIDNAMLYRINGLEKQTREKYDLELEDLQNKAIKANILENSMQPIYNVVAMLGVIMVIYLGGTKVIAGSWTVGNFSTYMIMFAALAAKASSAAKLFNSVQKSRISWQRIKPYLGEYRTKNTVQNIMKDHTVLNIEKLTFYYPESKESIIQSINLTARQGEIIGVTGAIASGKTTLGLSLLGLYPYTGSIRIDGKELRGYSEYERSQMIAYLGHNPQLLSDTIYNNITLGSNEDITAVLRDVCFDTDLDAMPDGINTLTGNRGIRLSGGQQARIALARTLLNKSKIIILDDPFSAVDMKTEEKIISNLKEHYQDCLIILISHRLAVFSHINRIVLLHNDRTVEYGTHQELMEKSEIYASIYNLQQLAGDSNE
ncbi:MAG TPA: ABC transporter ATP-binding protein [Sedimentisphaerales bacterium]|nr:ABC transporter ATP-binding protein [Sedimentisphaerales bacterium]